MNYCPLRSLFLATTSVEIRGTVSVREGLAAMRPDIYLVPQPNEPIQHR
jgi:hypothetical protein